MKHIILLTAALTFSGLFAGCNSAPKHDHDHAHHDGDHKDHKDHDCEACGGHKEAKSDCGCGEGSGHHEHGSTAAAAAETNTWSLSGNPQLNAEISQDDFNKKYEAKKTELGKKCSAAATKYCGKATEDLAVTQEEVVCLWSKAHRVTRERLAQLDNTSCARVLKGMTSKK